MAGDLVYFTIGVPDSERGRAFYAQVFGWEFASGNIPGGFHITGTNPPGGMHMGGSAPGFRPHRRSPIVRPCAIPHAGSR